VRREPGLTLRGALEVLGRHEPRLIEQLDTLLGGLILAAGMGAGLAAVGGPELAPLAAFGAAWGWVEQKDQALTLLHRAIDTVSRKMDRSRGYERQQLIVVAHTTIVVAAFFDVFSESVQDELRRKLQITEEDKQELIRVRPRQGETLFESLYGAEIPAPCAARGFDDNAREIMSWMSRLARQLNASITDIAGEEVDWPSILEKAVERYRSHYLTLAATVPEFMVWAMLGEHAATRSAVGELRADIAAALDASRHALGRVERLLALGSASDEGLNLCAVVERANRGVLSQPILPDTERYGNGIHIPAVKDIYINPRYRITLTENARPTDEKWWERERESRDDFDLMLASHVMAGDSIRLPMLLLGHPGAGKSLLMKVLAARMPAASYTVVRVPLRRVGANAPILDQVQQALNLVTHNRVEWWRLVEQSEHTIRVILLDGLDELLQATDHDRSGYLQEVMEFQRIEAEQGRPVVVVVTSRTVVADRVDIPDGTTIVKLDGFEQPDIEEWLRRWHRGNAAAIRAGKVRGLTLDAVLRQAELASQPLLLLMLALYSADPAFPALDADLPTSDLYRLLLGGFSSREVERKSEQKLRADELEQRVQDHLDRLSVAALAMFNRGQQDVTEDELGTDLAALHGEIASRNHAIEAGQRLIGEFFFVHAAEALPLSASVPDGDPADETPRPIPRRSYEFLHATFGEYLVAGSVVDELIEVARKTFGGRRGPGEPNDDRLFALMSHQPLAGRQSALTFAAEIFARKESTTRAQVLGALEMLIDSYRSRHDSGRYMAYRPTPSDSIRELAAYSANLIALRVTLEDARIGVPLTQIFRGSGDALQSWRSMLMLWRSGLDAGGLQAMAATVLLSRDADNADDRKLIQAENDEGPPGYLTTDILLARLADDGPLEDRLRFGTALRDEMIYSVENDNWASMMISWLVPQIAGMSGRAIFAAPPLGTPDADIDRVRRLLNRLLITPGHDSELDDAILRTLFELPRKFGYDGHALAAAVILRPEIVDSIPGLRDENVYGSGLDLVRMVGHPDLWGKIEKLADRGRPIHRLERAHKTWQDQLPKQIQDEIVDEIVAVLRTYAGAVEFVDGEIVDEDS